MNTIIDKTNWISFLKEYSSANEHRPTRLGVFEHDRDTFEDFWIEDGLPLVAVDAYREKDGVKVDILLENYTHPVEDVVRLIHYSDEKESGIDVIDESGRTTVLRFEDWQR